MTSNVMPSKIKMERRLLNELVAEVKETLATDVNLPANAVKSFGIVDLWNIQRNMSTANRPFSKKRNKIGSYIYP